MLIAQYPGIVRPTGSRGTGPDLQQSLEERQSTHITLVQANVRRGKCFMLLKTLQWEML